MAISARQKNGQKVGLVGLGVNLLLAVGKLLTGTYAHSIAIVADGMNNLMDCLSSVATIFGFRLAGSATDEEHPYGHGRIEYVAGFLVSLVIFITAYSVGQAAVMRLLTPESVQTSPVAIVVCLVAILVKLGLAFYYRHSNKKIDSKTIDAVVWDSVADALATTVALTSLLVAPLTEFPVDGVLGVVIALFIAYTGFKVFLENFNLILGQGLTTEERRGIRELMRQSEIIDRVTSLDVHDYGPEARILLAKVQLAVRPDATQFQSELEKLKKLLKEQFGLEEVIIYWSPAKTK